MNIRYALALLCGTATIPSPSFAEPAPITLFCHARYTKPESAKPLLGWQHVAAFPGLQVEASDVVKQVWNHSSAQVTPEASFKISAMYRPDAKIIVLRAAFVRTAADGTELVVVAGKGEDTVKSLTPTWQTSRPGVSLEDPAVTTALLNASTQKTLKETTLGDLRDLLESKVIQEGQIVSAQIDCQLN